MSKQTIDIGSSPNDGSGDSLRVSFGICNDNFDELYPVVTTSDPTVTDDSDSNYQNGKVWINSDTNRVFQLIDNSVGAAFWQELTKQESINAQTGTTYTLVLADRNKAITMANASANTLTIPANSSVAFKIGVQIEVWMKGAGTTSVEGDTGVTLNGVSAGSGDISAQYGRVVLLKIGTDTWLMSGDHGTVS